MLWKKISRKEEYRGGATLNKVMKEGHIQKGIFEANHIDIKREQRIVPGRGNS